MDAPSILNDVLGPVMRGPSSSHTAGSFRIGKMVRALSGDLPVSAVFSFDPQGSYARTFREQGADKAFAAGLLGWDIRDGRFFDALELAGRAGLALEFRIERLEGADHPNAVWITLRLRSGRSLAVKATSTGGGGVVIHEMAGHRTELSGQTYGLLVLADPEAAAALEKSDLAFAGRASVSLSAGPGGVLLTCKAVRPFAESDLARLKSRPGVRETWAVNPLVFVPRGEALFSDAAGMVEAAGRQGWSLGAAALAYESRLLALDEDRVLAEVGARFDVMREAVRDGLDDAKVRMRLLGPSARRVLSAEASGRLAVGGPHARAAGRALAALHTANSVGVICAAPTGASSGVIPGVLTTLAEDRGLAGRALALSLLAAGAVGLVVSRRATFAAETAGCQVEIGAAGAMAAAAIVEAVGGRPREALDAAAISFQNTMGSVCDPVQGYCEIPCHTRNAAAASAAFTAADLILGGYENPIPLDETVDAVLSAGLMLPCELRCTARGGLALAPSAVRLAARTATGAGRE